MDIVRNADGTLVVPVMPDGGTTPMNEAAPPPTRGDAERRRPTPSPPRGCSTRARAATTRRSPSGTSSRTPIGSRRSRPPAAGRRRWRWCTRWRSRPTTTVAPAVEALDDPEASGEALRHVLVGGVHSVEDFAAEVAEAEGGEPLPAHQATKIIGEVLAELDKYGGSGDRPMSFGGMVSPMDMSLPEIATHDEWLAARKELLAREKALTRARDALNAERRQLPMVRVEKDYRSRGRTARSRCSTCSRAAAS